MLIKLFQIQYVSTINYAVPKVFIIQNIIYLRNNVQKHNKLIKRVVI